MTFQRRRAGLPATFYPIIKVLDSRGNEKKIHDEANPTSTTVWVFPQRSAKAEVTGQQEVNVVRVGFREEIPNIGLGSQVDFMGTRWDVAAPPSYHHGTSRHTRHWSADIRKRPSRG